MSGALPLRLQTQEGSDLPSTPVICAVRTQKGSRKCALLLRAHVFLFCVVCPGCQKFPR